MTLRLLIAILLCFSAGARLSAQGDPCGSITIAGVDTLSICLGASVDLTQSNSLVSPIVSWTPAADLVGTPGRVAVTL